MSIVLGPALLTGDGVSPAMMAAVFLTKLRESIAATVGLRVTGWSARDQLPPNGPADRLGARPRHRE